MPHLRHSLQVGIGTAMMRAAIWLTDSTHEQCCTQAWEKEHQEIHGFLCCQRVERKPQRWYHDMWKLCEIHVSLSLRKIMLGYGQRHSYLYICGCSLHTASNNVKWGYSKDHTIYALSYLLSGPTSEKPTDLVFISYMVEESEPLPLNMIDIFFQTFYVRGRKQYSWARSLFTVGGMWIEGNIWRGKRLYLRFLVGSTFLFKKKKN